MKKTTLILAIFIILSIITGCSVPGSTRAENTSPPQDFTGMGNPSAVYCQELGYQFKIVTDAQGESGVCILPENQECNAWDFLEGECGQEHSYCAQQGLDTVVKHDGKNGLSRSYAVCVDENQEEIGTAVEMMDLEEKSLGCGVGLEETRTPDASGAEPAPPLDFVPPTSFDWRSYSGGDWLTPVKNQGVCGSCWAFAAVGVTESTINIALDDPAYDLNLSEQYLVADCYQEFDFYGTCCGGRKSYALDYIWEFGIPDESCLPYVDGSGCSCYNADPLLCADDPFDVPCAYDSTTECSDRECADRCGDWESRLVYNGNNGYAGTNEMTIKQYLVDTGPLAVSLDMGGYWDGDIFRCLVENGTNHAVAIVGYEDYLSPPPPPALQGHWIVRNSWGSTWNGDGYFKVGYGECSIGEYVYYTSPERVDWYVSPSGNDGNDCRSWGASCLTIQGAIDKAGAGGTVNVAAGAYNENIIMKSGVDVVGNSPADTSIVGTASVDGVVKFDGVTHTTLQKFWITVATPVPGTDRGVVFEGSTDDTAAIKNSIITNTQYGIFVKSPSSPTIENNTLVADSDEQGIYIGNSATNPTIRNNIITGYDTTGIRVVAGTSPPQPVITYNDLWNNGANYVSYPDQTGINGNISADPDFVDPGCTNYHLADSSLAINAGDPASDYANEPAPNGGRINIGAYGNTGEAATSSARPIADFDGDGDTDISVFRPSNGKWYIYGEAPIWWGMPGDIPVPANYDGDSDTDLAVFRPSNGKWYVYGEAPVWWGMPDDVPMPGDYDGNGSEERAVFRPSNGKWYVYGASTVWWGMPGDIPVPGDYDGNGSTDIAVFRPSNGKWYVYGETPVWWGMSGDIPVPGDYDGNGSTDIAVYRPSNGKWYVNGEATVWWGKSGDIPVPGDYDGNGSTDIAVVRPSNGKWYILGGSTVWHYLPDDFPLPVRDTNADGDPYQ